MNCTGTGEIVEAHLADEAAAPDPVTGDRVNHKADHKTVYTVRREFCTLSHGTGNDSSRGCTEDSLENQKCPERNTVRKHCASVICLGGNSADSSEEAVSCSKHNTETNQPECRSTDTEVHQVFHDNVTCVFCSGETGFHHCEACLHEEDKRGANKHPDCVYC